MAEITAAMVKELREITGLGMMECKKALVETNADLKSAEDLLRVKSGAKANKAAGRVASEGVIGACLSDDGKCAALVGLASRYKVSFHELNSSKGINDDLSPIVGHDNSRLRIRENLFHESRQVSFCIF